MTAPQNTATAGGAQLVDAPVRSTDDKLRPECRHWIGTEQRHCKQVDGVRRYLPGFRCPAHTPRALQGLPEIPTGPGWPIHRTQEEK